MHTHVSKTKIQSTELSSRTGWEVIIDAKDESLVPDAVDFLHFVTEYIDNYSAIVKANETLVYGYWVVRFKRVNDDRLLELWEVERDGSGFVPGGRSALRYWKMQHELSAAHGMGFDAPVADRLVTVTPGVMEGLPVEGTRYFSETHHSGWVLLTDRDADDLDARTDEHACHVTAQRDDLAQFLALPAGSRFYIDGDEVEVIFDEELAAMRPD